jgi:hypothetical protein
LGYESLGTILAITVVGTYLLAALLFLIASRIPPSGSEEQEGSRKAQRRGGSERSPLLSSNRKDVDSDNEAA